MHKYVQKSITCATICINMHKTNENMHKYAQNMHKYAQNMANMCKNMHKYA